MCYRPADAGRTRSIEVNPLVITPGLRERIDARLIDEYRLARAKITADQTAQVGGGLEGLRIGSSAEGARTIRKSGRRVVEHPFEEFGHAGNVTN